MECKSCSAAVGPWDEARYDVLRPGADLDHPEQLGPYCADCWPMTPTGAAVTKQGENT